LRRGLGSDLERYDHDADPGEWNDIGMTGRVLLTPLAVVADPVMFGAVIAVSSRKWRGPAPTFEADGEKEIRRTRCLRGSVDGSFLSS